MIIPKIITIASLRSIIPEFERPIPILRFLQNQKILSSSQKINNNRGLPHIFRALRQVRFSVFLAYLMVYPQEQLDHL
jgi:hypothetical protein